MPDYAFDVQFVEAQWGSVSDSNYCTILVIFVAEAAKLCEDIQAALQGMQRRTIVQLAHTLQGAAANVGARALATAAANLQHAAQISQADNLAVLVGEVDRANELVQSMIRAGGPARYVD